MMKLEIIALEKFKEEKLERYQGMIHLNIT